MLKLLKVCLLIQSAAALPGLCAAKTTLLAFGDSITERTDSYRSVLVPALIDKGLDIEFIGPKRDELSSHAGYSGRNTNYLRSLSKQIYSEYPADIVLIHTGHNSFSKDAPVAGIIRDTAAIIENIRGINPEVQILLAQVIPSAKLPKYAYIPELNEALASLAQRLQAGGARIRLVNQADGFDCRADTHADRVHPNASGAKKIAEKWMAALLPALGHTELLAYEQLRLWDGAAPGVPAGLEAQRALAHGRVSHVSVPTLDVYRPHQANGTVIVVCSGGAYAKLASGPLGLGAADEFLKDGYTVCSLKYRLSPPSTDVVGDACMDGARALRLVRYHARDWNVDPERVVMLGFSAGANLVLNLACSNDAGDAFAGDPLERLSAQPDCMVLAALWHNQQVISDWGIHPQLPPALIFSTRDDRTAPTQKAEAIAEAFREVQVPVQVEIYERGGHMAFNFPAPKAADWPQRFRQWIRQLNFKPIR